MFIRLTQKEDFHTSCHSVPGAWHIKGCYLSAGGSLQWFRNKLCQEEIAKSKNQV
jgi:xylulokinase